MRGVWRRLLVGGRGDGAGGRVGDGIAGIRVRGCLRPHCRWCPVSRTAARRGNLAAVVASQAPVADLYLRLSDLRGEDMTPDGIGKTFADREAKLRQEATRLGWTVARVVTENDVAKTQEGRQRGASAFKRRLVPNSDPPQYRVWRPGFQSILDDIRAGRVTALLCEDLDRVLRDHYDCEDTIVVTRAKRANVKSLSGSLTFSDGGTDAEITMARFLTTIAAKSSMDTQRRVADSRRRRAHAGEFGGGRRPYGFDPDGITPRWDECMVIATCAYRILQGFSLRSLAAELREAEVPTVTGRPWTPSTLRDVLIRERNAGIMVYQGEEIGSAPWRPIVPEHMHRKVVALLTDPKRRTNAGRTPRWLGSGIYRCGVELESGHECGSTVWVTGGTNRAPRYVCKSGNGGHVVRNAIATDAYVRDTVVERLSRPDAALCFATTGPGVDVDALRRESQAIREGLSDLAELLLTRAVTREQVASATTKGRKRLDEIAKTLAGAADAQSPVAPLLAARDVGKAFDALPLSARRAVVSAVVSVTVLPVAKRGAGFDPDHVQITPRRDFPPVPGLTAGPNDGDAATAA